MQVEAYAISKINGFLLEPDPLTSLPQEHEFFRKLDRMRWSTPRYFGTEKFRAIIDDFSSFYLTQVAKGDQAELNDIHEYLKDERVARLARLTLGTLMQAYVLGSPHEAGAGNVVPRIPAGVAVPMAYISELLDVPPILAYQDYCLANWERVDKGQPVELGNIMILQYLLGGLDEAWFILVHTDIEARMGKVPDAFLIAFRGVHANNVALVANGLTTIKVGLDAMNTTFLRMPEYCSSDIFFERVRPYIHGQEGNPALPNGVIYEGVSEKPFSLRGESGAQSSIIPLCAAGLGVVYPDDWLSQYVREMHAYMPRGHRRFIADVVALEKHFSIRAFVDKHKETHPFLFDAFHVCLEAGREFLIQHAAFTEEYIHRHSAKSTAANPHNIGTGGSDFMNTLLRHADCWKLEIENIRIGVS